MKTVFVLLGLLLLIALGGKFAMDYFAKNPISLMKPQASSTATIGNNTFNLYVAKSAQEKQTGLTNRDSLDYGYGMIFLFEQPGFYSFWMKNMKFSIDILFIKNNKIVTIHKNAQPVAASNENPPVYSSTEPADSVLELPAGSVKKYTIKQGDEVKVNLK